MRLVGRAPLSALSTRIATVTRLDPAAQAVEFEGAWRTWGQLNATIEGVAASIAEPGTRVGVLLRNGPASVGLVLGVLRAGGCVVTINPHRGVESVRADLASLDLRYLAGEPADVAAFATPTTTTLATAELGTPVEVMAAASGDTALKPGVAIQMLTSGTTGPPKRVDLAYRTIERVLAGAKHYEGDQSGPLRLRSGVAVVNAPLVHLGGLFRVLQCVNDGRSFALLERFTVEGWADAVRRHRPATVSLVPAALRMVLDADLDPADLASVRSVVSGTAPLSPDDADAFTAKYGVPVLVSYAATEFGGGVAGWNLADHRRFWAAKRGSVGRPHPGCELRVLDVETGEPLPADAEGILEVKAAQLGSGQDWVRTTDLARIDADGFVWILGRADQAIIRGGFKIRPEDVRVALERHPAVRSAAVVGRADRRLGAVPVAAVELRSGADPVTPGELAAHATGLLARYELPVEIRIVDDLPRTPSAKVDLAAVSALLDATERWTFGVQPLQQTVRAAASLRRVTSLILALEEEEASVDVLLDALDEAERALTRRVPADLSPRVGAAVDTEGRVYLDHSRDVGAFNPGVPTYEITVEGDSACGTVNFPLAYEGPPGIVHGGFLALFFDAAIQQHGCDVGVAGKTIELAIRYRRPVPLHRDLWFTLSRSVEGSRARSTGRLFPGKTTDLPDQAADTMLCEVRMDTVRGDRSRLPEVSPRRSRA